MFLFLLNFLFIFQFILFDEFGMLRKKEKFLCLADKSEGQNTANRGFIFTHFHTFFYVVTTYIKYVLIYKQKVHVERDRSS